MKGIRAALPWVLWILTLAAMSVMGMRNNPGGSGWTGPRALTQRQSTPSAPQRSSDCHGITLDEGKDVHATR